MPKKKKDAKEPMPAPSDVGSLITRTVWVPMTPEQTAHAGRQLAGLELRLQDLRKSLVRARRDLRSRIKLTRNERAMLAQIILEGRESQQVECEAILTQNGREVAYVTPGGVLVDTRAATDADRQHTLSNLIIPPSAADNSATGEKARALDL